MKNNGIDAGKDFDFGKTSSYYAEYRDIYPEIFYNKIAARKLCISGQKVLDIGTGTGVLPRNMYRFGAEWTGTDISAKQIEQAEKLSLYENKNIRFITSAAEDTDFPENSFDVITACQCFWYFDHSKMIPKLSSMLKSNGTLLILYMAWLPFEDKIAGASEKLVLKYSPTWSGAGERMHPIEIPECVLEYFEPFFHEEYKISLPFTRETWNGRMKSCRGVGASLTASELNRWENEHRALLERIAPERFNVAHYAAVLELRKKRKKV